jgi:hypothetical protein
MHIYKSLTADISHNKDMNTDIDNIEREKLYQIAGDIIINRYEKYESIPDKYRDLYKTYKPLLVGKKRKATEELSHDIS